MRKKVSEVLLPLIKWVTSGSAGHIFNILKLLWQTDV